MADVRRFRDELIRQIEKRATAPLLSGVVADSPDTIAHTVLVRVGNSDVVAAYRGEHPQPGDPVEVQRSGAGYKVIVSVAKESVHGASAGGPALDLAKHLNTDHANLPTIGEVGQAIADAGAVEPVGFNTAFIGTLETWGHSFLDMAGNPGPSSHYQISNRLFSALNLSWPHAKEHGQGGTTVTGDWKRMFRTARPFWDNYGDTMFQSKFGPQVFLFGANDVGKNGHPMFENGRYLNDWGNAWRGIFSWFRAGAIYTPDWIFGGTGHTGGASSTAMGIDQAALDSLIDPGGKAGVTYGANWVATTSDNYVSVAQTAMQTTVSSSSFTVRLPPRFPGTPVTLYFAGEVGPTGSTNGSVTHPGPTSPVALVTNDRVRTPSVYLNVIAPVVPLPSLYPVRLVGIPPGDGSTSQTITVNAGTLGSGRKLTFLGWSIEATHPPLLVPGSVCTARSWASGLLNTANLGLNPDGSYVGSGTVPLHWCSYPQSNSVQSVGGGPAYNGGVRNGPHDADMWIRDYYNPRLVEVAAEFEPVGSVAIADLGTVMDGTVYPEYWSPNDLGGTDHFHPNNLGKAIIAQEFLTAMNRVPLPLLYLMAPRLPDEMFEGFDSLVAST